MGLQCQDLLVGLDFLLVVVNRVLLVDLPAVLFVLEVVLSDPLLEGCLVVVYRPYQISQFLI